MTKEFKPTMTLEAALAQSMSAYEPFINEDAGRGINARTTVAMLPPFIRVMHTEQDRLMARGDKIEHGDRTIVRVDADAAEEYAKGFAVTFSTIVVTMAANMFPCQEGGENGLCDDCRRNRISFIMEFCDDIQHFAVAAAAGEIRTKFSMGHVDADAKRKMT